MASAHLGRCGPNFSSTWPIGAKSATWAYIEPIGPKLEPTGPSSAQFKLGPSWVQVAPVRPSLMPKMAKSEVRLLLSSLDSNIPRSVSQESMPGVAQKSEFEEHFAKLSREGISQEFLANFYLRSALNQCWAGVAHKSV